MSEVCSRWHGLTGMIKRTSEEVAWACRSKKRHRSPAGQIASTPIAYISSRMPGDGAGHALSMGRRGKQQAGMRTCAVSLGCF